MDNHFSLVVISFAISMLVFAKATSPTPKIKLVAQSDGKSFFAEMTPARNWTEAGRYCKSMGMKLASITSANQFIALKISYNADDFHNGFWTSGRDSHELRQFSWNEIGNQLSPEYLTFGGTQGRPFFTCVYFDCFETESYIRAIECEYNMGTLCEV